MKDIIAAHGCTALGSERAQERNWRSAAVCRDADPELFFPTAAAGAVYEAQVSEAKSVCRRCPVVAACLTDALARAPYGIAGGLTEAERSAARTARRGTRPPGAERSRTGTARRVIVPPSAVGQGTDPVMAAAVRLVEGGQSIVRVAERLGLSERTVSTYAGTARAAMTQSVAS